LDDFFALEKTLVNKGLDISFGALTWFSPAVVAALYSFSFPLEAPRLLPAILVVTRCFTRMRSGATMGEAAEKGFWGEG
jgi:hypothetical protein